MGAPRAAPYQPSKINISQIFGPTFQGEGTATGQHCLFVRTYGCNLHCKWCDTAYTWADTEHKAGLTESKILYDKNDPKLGLKEMTAAEVIKELMKLWDIEACPTTIIISGGEPMMQQAKLLNLVEALAFGGNQVHIETAGTLEPAYLFDAYVTQYNVSPKLMHSGNPVSKRYKPDALQALIQTGKARFKFVVRDTTDLEEVAQIVRDCRIPRSTVMIMPEGTTLEKNLEVSRAIANQVLKMGYGLSGRLHVALWGDDVDK